MTDNRPLWAKRLQSEREARGWSKAEMARQLMRAAGLECGDVDSLARQIRSWEKGVNRPRDWRPHYATAFGIPEDELITEPPLGYADADADRRHLLASLALLGVDTASRTEPLEPIRQALNRAIPGGLHGHLVQDWEETAFEHGHAFLTTPPHELLPDLAADLVSLLTSIRTVPDGATRDDLCGPAGKLAALMAMTVSTLGERRHARDWWKTARHAADASRDQDLQVWVRGYEAMNSLYSGRPLTVVLRLADQAIAIGGRAAGAAALEAMASRAQALAMMGRQQEADEALHALANHWERLPAAAPDDRLATGAWPETALQHTIAFTTTHTGAFDRATQAQDAAAALYPPQMRRQRAQIELLRATSLVRAGDVTAGVEHAGRTIEALATVQRTTTIQRGARMVLEAVPDTDLTTSAVRDYRDAFALPAPEED